MSELELLGIILGTAALGVAVWAIMDGRKNTRILESLGLVSLKQQEAKEKFVLPWRKRTDKLYVTTGSKTFTTDAYLVAAQFGAPFKL